MGTESKILVGVIDDGFLKIAAYGVAEGSADDMGFTDGGAEVSVEREYFDVKVDQALGTIRQHKIGEEMTLKVTLSEASLESLRIAMDLPTSVIDGTTLTMGGDKDVNVLTIYLNVPGPSGGSRKYTFHKCVCISAAAHSYKKDEKTMIECEFRVLQDLTKTTDEQRMTIVDTGDDTTAPTIAMTTPADGGTVTKEGKGTVLLTFTETNAMDESSIIYGDTIQILNTTGGSEGLTAGSIVYNSTAKTILFTPDGDWTASETHLVVVSTGVKDQNGNNLASTFVGDFSVTS